MTLIVADDAQKRARDRLAHEAWGQQLTVDQFVAREERLRAHPWAQRNMSSWLLVDGDQILSSCESFEMRSLLEGQEGRTLGVASVYTEPAFRGRGHAGRMMELLAEKLGDHQAGILFSDVGDYYSRFGWRTVAAIERVLPAISVENRAEILTSIEADWNTLQIPRSRFLVWPTLEQLDWHRERERAYADLLGRAALRWAGARTGSGLAAWAADFKNDKLVILHLQAQSAEDTRALVAAAQTVAAEGGLSRVSVWDVMAPWPEDLAPTGTRSDSLPMLLPMAAGSEEWSFVPRGLWI